MKRIGILLVGMAMLTFAVGGAQAATPITTADEGSTAVDGEQIACAPWVQIICTVYYTVCTPLNACIIH